MTLPSLETDHAVAAQQSSGLPTIGLQELVLTASRQTRVDRKYLVPRSDLPDLLRAVANTGRVLEIDGRQEFGYRSTYFDTGDARSFFDAGRGRRLRWKVRTREYLDADGSFVEIKTRGARGLTVKSRHPLSGGAGQHLTDAEQQLVSADLVSHGIYTVPVDQLRPLLHTAYRRLTVVIPGSVSGLGDRVTVDTDLQWRTVSDPDRQLNFPHLSIVETKAGGQPTVVDRALWRLGMRPQRISKYGIGLAALTPSLPHLKWHRLLNGELRLARSSHDTSTTQFCA